jgi:hypothetical protein
MDNNYPEPYDDSLLSTVSREINFMLGDRTGRTVTHRTTQGMKRMFDLPELSDDTGSHIVHVGMIAVPVLLTRKNPTARFIGFVILIFLFLWYQMGKVYAFPEKPNQLNHF